MVITFYFIQYCTELFVSASTYRSFSKSKNIERKCSSVFCSFELQITMKNFETVFKTDLALLQ